MAKAISDLCQICVRFLTGSLALPNDVGILYLGAVRNGKSGMDYSRTAQVAECTFTVINYK